MTSSPSEPIGLSQVLSESRRIITLQSHHFQTLTLLFLFPLSLSPFLYLTLQQPKPHDHLLLFQSDHQQSFFLSPLLYTLVFNLFSLFAVASISYSAYRVSHDEPVDLISSLTSIFTYFWPLVSTSLVVGVIVGVFVTIPFVLLVFFVYKWLQNSSYFVPLLVLIGLIFALVIISLQVKWVLAYVVVVVESKWGFAPLKRSADLIKGNRGVALKMVLCFQLITIWMFLIFRGSGSDRWWFGLLMMLSVSFPLSQILLVSFVAATVLYIHCRESHEGVLPSQKIHPEKFPLLL